MRGCRVQVGNESVRVEEDGFEHTAPDHVNLPDKNPRDRRYLKFVPSLKGFFGKRTPVAQPILQGLSEMIATMHGSSDMSFDFYDHPDEFRQRVEHCTDLSMHRVNAQHAATGPFAGGYIVEQLGNWIPDRRPWLQEAVSTLFCSRFCTTLLQPWSWRMAEAFPYAAIHLHPSSLLLLDRIFDVKPLGCVQLSKGAGTRRLPRWCRTSRWPRHKTTG